jgi:1-acyl-sn-glycerol-3-phosphate acyltransferase
MLFWITLQNLTRTRSRFDPLIKLLCRACLVPFGIRVRVTGRERLSESESVLYMANHVSILDPILLFAAIPGRVRGVELEDHFSWPIWGSITRRIGNIPISHRNTAAAIASLDRAAKALRGGTSIVILPEGHRTRTGEPGPFMRGPFRLASQTSATIVPVALRDLYDRKNVHSPRMHPGTVTVAFGRALPPAEYAHLSDRKTAALLHERIVQLLKDDRRSPSRFGSD